MLARLLHLRNPRSVLLLVCVLAAPMRVLLISYALSIRSPVPAPPVKAVLPVRMT
jgi:hypothetical protein